MHPCSLIPGLNIDRNPDRAFPLTLGNISLYQLEQSRNSGSANLLPQLTVQAESQLDDDTFSGGYLVPMLRRLKGEYESYVAGSQSELDRELFAH